MVGTLNLSFIFFVSRSEPLQAPVPGCISVAGNLWDWYYQQKISGIRIQFLIFWKIRGRYIRQKSDDRIYKNRMIEIIYWNIFFSHVLLLMFVVVKFWSCSIVNVCCCKILVMFQAWANNSTSPRYSLLRKILVYEPMKKDPELFALSPSWIPVFYTNMPGRRYLSPIFVIF